MSKNALFVGIRDSNLVGNANLYTLHDGKHLLRCRTISRCLFRMFFSSEFSRQQQAFPGHIYRQRFSLLPIWIAWYRSSLEQYICSQDALVLLLCMDLMLLPFDLALKRKAPPFHCLKVDVRQLLRKSFEISLKCLWAGNIHETVFRQKISAFCWVLKWISLLLPLKVYELRLRVVTAIFVPFCFVLHCKYNANIRQIGIFS